MHRRLVRRGTWADRQDELVRASRDKVIHVHELVRLGVPERTAYRRTQQDGPWTLLFPATILLSNGAPTLRQREIAALTYAGPGATLTGLSGARHHRMYRGGDVEDVHLLIHIDERVQSRPGLIIERTCIPIRPMLRDELAVAPLARCIIDHVRLLKDHDTIAAILTEPVQRRRLLPEMLVDELERGTRKGSGAPRAVLRAVRRGVQSVAEFQADAFWQSHRRLPTIAWNVAVYALDGTLIGYADGLVRELGFVWEIDSVEQHFATPTQVAETAARRRRFEAAGFHVLSTRPNQRRDDPAGVLADIETGLKIAALLPPPRATYGPALGLRDSS